MPLPIAHGLVGASVMALALPTASPARNWKLLLAGAALGACPDLDYALGTAWHRGFTHSLLFAFAVGLVCFAATGFAKMRVAVGCTCAVLSHGLLDFATTKTMPGVELFWPFSSRRFRLGLIDYYHVTGIDPVFFLYKNILADLLKAAAVEMLIFVPVFLLALSVRWGMNKLSHS